VNTRNSKLALPTKTGNSGIQKNHLDTI